MENLKLEHISSYLPYGLKAYGGISKRVYTMTCAETNAPDRYSIEKLCDEFMNLKPILRPLSDLTKEIVCNKVKIIPAIEIAKCIHGAYEHVQNIKVEFTKSGNSIKISSNVGNLGSIHINMVESCLHSIKYKHAYDINAYTFLEIQNLLHKWKFDYQGLIDQGLAINVNSLKENCYEVYS